MEPRFPVPPRTLQFKDAEVPLRSETYYKYTTDSYVYVADDAARLIGDFPPGGCTVAIDIETQGLDKFKIRCVTGAWTFGRRTINVFLDPRFPNQRAAIQRMIDVAKDLVLHNAVYDIPGLYQTGLMELDHIDKIWDTLVVARMYDTSNKGGRSLEELCSKFNIMADNEYKISDAYAVMGHKPGFHPVTGERMSAADMGFHNMTPHDPVYREGALADTVATLRLLPVLWNETLNHQLRMAHIAGPPRGFTGDERERILYLMNREQVTNRVMLRRSAIGIAADLDYAERFTAEFERTKRQKQAVFETLNIDTSPGKITQETVEFLYNAGRLNSNWPRSAKTDKLSASKKDTKGIDNTLIRLATDLKEHDKILGYLNKIIAMARTTGRIHPEVGVLGAHATGRMSYRFPELQQFPSRARPILRADEGRNWTSIDWSSIEPVVLTNVAHDFDYLEGFNKDEDLYLPSARVAGLIPWELSDEEAMEHPGRKKAKTVVLANMYGQGQKLLASNLGVSIEEAKEIKEQYNSAMLKTVKFLDQVRKFAGQNGFIRTIDGRGLTVPVNHPDPNKPWNTDPYVGFKAMNYIVQGTAYSLLSETINAIHRAGLEDALIMAVHDELIVDTEATDEIQKIMVTPPQWLNEAAGREVYLRSDSNDMGKHWKYV